MKGKDRGLNIGFDTIDGKFIKTVAALLDTTSKELIKDAVLHRIMTLASDRNDDVLKTIYKAYIAERVADIEGGK